MKTSSSSYTDENTFITEQFIQLQKRLRQKFSASADRPREIESERVLEHSPATGGVARIVARHWAALIRAAAPTNAHPTHSHARTPLGHAILSVLATGGSGGKGGEGRGGGRQGIVGKKRDTGETNSGTGHGLEKIVEERRRKKAGGIPGHRRRPDELVEQSQLCFADPGVAILGNGRRDRRPTGKVSAQGQAWTASSSERPATICHPGLAHPMAGLRVAAASARCSVTAPPPPYPRFARSASLSLTRSRVSLFHCLRPQLTAAAHLVQLVEDRTWGAGGEVCRLDPACGSRGRAV